MLLKLVCNESISRVFSIYTLLSAYSLGVTQFLLGNNGSVTLQNSRYSIRKSCRFSVNFPEVGQSVDVGRAVMRVGVDLTAFDFKQAYHDLVFVIAKGNATQKFHAPARATIYPARRRHLYFSHLEVFTLRGQKLIQSDLVIDHLRQVYQTTFKALFDPHVIPVRCERPINHTWQKTDVGI